MTPEVEGDYIVKHPSGTTAKTRKILALIKQKGMFVRSVYNFLKVCFLGASYFYGRNHNFVAFSLSDLFFEDESLKKDWRYHFGELEMAPQSDMRCREFPLPANSNVTRWKQWFLP